MDTSIILNGLKLPDTGGDMYRAIGMVNNVANLPLQNKMLGEELLSAQLGNESQKTANQYQSQLLQQKVEQNRLGNESAVMSNEKEKQLGYLRAAAPDANQMLALINAGQPDRARQLLVGRINMLKEQGRDPSDSEAVLQAFDAGDIDGVKSELGTVVENATRLGVFGLDTKGKPAGVQEWEYYSQLSPEQRAQYREMQRGYADPLELAAGRAGINIGEYQSKRAIEAQTAPSIAAGTEAARLAAQQDALPQVEGAVTSARETAKSNVENAQTRNKSNRAFYVYNAGIQRLKAALEKTTTGPIVGRLPAFTAEAQTAEGAQKIMLPVLKDMFRTAGEGVFTDKDQETLANMLPNRTDEPEAAAAKLEAIDAIVKAKLGIGEAAPAQGQSETPKTPSIEDLVNKYAPK